MTLLPSICCGSTLLGIVVVLSEAVVAAGEAAARPGLAIHIGGGSLKAKLAASLFVLYRSSALNSALGKLVRCIIAS